MSFVAQLHTIQTIKPSHPWTASLRRIKGSKGSDGVERIPTDRIFDYLDLPPFKRTPEAAKQVRGVMVELGWTPIRARAVSARGRAARVRGYARAACS